MNGYYTKFRSNINRGIYPLGERATEEYEEARKKIAEFIGAKPGKTPIPTIPPVLSSRRSIKAKFRRRAGS